MMHLKRYLQGHFYLLLQEMKVAWSIFTLSQPLKLHGLG
jgi:hypothetical protein